VMRRGPVRTLVVHTGGIGDLLLCAPSVQALGHDGPVEVAGMPDRLALLVGGGAAVRAHHLDSIGFASAFTGPSARLRDFLAGFNRVVVWMADKDSSLQAALVSCGPRDVRVFPGLPPKDWCEHASHYYLDQLGLGPRPPFQLSAAGPSREHDVIIHPGSGGRAKNWPLDRFKTLAARLTHCGRQVEWCLGPAEHEAGFDCKGEVLCRDELMALTPDFCGAKLYVGNDSGITHLAAACGCRTLALFGPTDPVVWAPQGEHVKVLRGTPWPSLDEVAAEAQGEGQ